MTRQEEAKAALASTDDSLVSLQVTIRNQTEVMASYERTLAGLGPDDPGRPAIEALLKEERDGQQESQTYLGKLVKVRTRLHEVIEKAEG